MSDVLIVDDEPDIGDVLADLLVDAGLTVEVARDGVEALARVRAARPRVVVTDLMMPRMDGYTLIEQLQQNPDTAGIALLAISAAGDTSRLRRYDVPLAPKPLDVDLFVEQVLRLAARPTE